MIVLLDMEREDEALAMVNRIVEEFPGDAMMLRMAAEQYRELDEYDLYEATIARAREIVPDSELQNDGSMKNGNAHNLTLHCQVISSARFTRPVPERIRPISCAAA